MTEREKYTRIRYEYYHSGRNLYLSGCFFSGSILLGYAVETTLKAGLLEVLTREEIKRESQGIGKRRGVLMSHDIGKIFTKCTNKGIFTDIKISPDFIQHIENNFQRYPSQIRKVSENAKVNNICLMHSGEFVYYYDNLIISLDRALLEFTNDVKISVTCAAYRSLETKYARDFFRENAFALNNFSYFKNIILEDLPERQDLRNEIIENLKRGPFYYWQEGREMDSAPQAIKKICKEYGVENYKLPKWLF